jgi:hypothetical protein
VADSQGGSVVFNINVHMGPGAGLVKVPEAGAAFAVKITHWVVGVMETIANPGAPGPLDGANLRVKLLFTDGAPDYYYQVWYVHNGIWYPAAPPMGHTGTPTVIVPVPVPGGHHNQPVTVCAVATDANGNISSHRVANVPLTP